MKVCDRVQDTLTASGPEAFRDDLQAREHLAECDACFALMEALAAVDLELGALPPIDAADALVEATLRRIAAEHPVAPEVSLEVLSAIHAAQGDGPRQAAASQGDGHSGAERARSAPFTAERSAAEAKHTPRWRRWSGAAGRGITALLTAAFKPLLALLRLMWAASAWMLQTGPRRAMVVMGVLAVGLWSVTVTRYEADMMAPARSQGAAYLEGQEKLAYDDGYDEIMPPPPSPGAVFGGAVPADSDSAMPSDGRSEVRNRKSGGRRPEAPVYAEERISAETKAAPTLVKGEGRVGLGVQAGGAGGLAELASPTMGSPEPVQMPIADAKQDDTLSQLAKTQRAKMPMGSTSSLGDTTRQPASANSVESLVAKPLAAPQVGNKPPPEALWADSDGDPWAPSADMAAAQPQRQQLAVDQAKKNTQSSATLALSKDKQLADASEDASNSKRRASEEGELSYGLHDLKVAHEVLEKPAYQQGSVGVHPQAPLSPPDEGRHFVQDFMDARERLEDLTYKDATGYWANTYVPGDPELRALHARFEKLNRVTSDTLQALHQPTQPFDAPEDAAMAVYLQSDKAAVSGPTRMLVQVGLKGTSRFSGSRPAMNIGLVLDLTQPLSADDAASARALLFAFEQAQDPGDRISLSVAGPAGGLLLPARDFRHGPLAVTLDELLTPATGQRAEPIPLSLALGMAMQQVATDNDPTATLGSSAVILITPRHLATEAQPLVAMAHASAVAGVPMSVVGLGAQADRPALTELVLAGQGNLRMLSAPAEAADLVEREINAVARVIARAVRLRIRLAKGVKLVDVLGSYNLAEAEAERVRQAEQSIDRRLSKNLGIVSDRGEDEEGIQIVIPAFYAEDSHVILLDVVAEGPGPIADVTVRYKDLVHLRNGVSRANLTSQRGDDTPRGPLEFNVLKNFLNFQFSSVMSRAAAQLSDSASSQASIDQVAVRLHELGLLLGGAQLVYPELYGDADLEAARAFVAQTGTFVGTEDELLRRMADVYRYAGLIQIQPEPRTD